MKEEFLHHLWKYGLYSKPLKLVSGENVEVISPGEHNMDAGPDFFNAKIKIGETIWAGNVEIHIKGSDWYKHKHQNNEAYNNIILHVVAENDKLVTRQNGKAIPTLILESPKLLYKQYAYLMHSADWIPCESFIATVDDFTILQWKEALLVERLTQKAELILERFSASTSNWEETFYLSLAHNFGFKTNALPFEMLAKSIPLSYLGKHKDQLDLVEAMLFGQSGLLPNNSNEEYVNKLQTNYKHLATKFNLKPMSGHLWKFMRLRPANFPSIRIAQFAALIHKSSGLFSKIIETESLDELQELFNVQASKYWESHYSFANESKAKPKNLGKIAFHNILINTIVPVLFLYGQHKKQYEYSDKALNWLLAIPSEKNSIIAKWLQLGLSVENAFDSQALIQLKNVYCKKRHCLSCRIGNQVIKHVI